MKVTAIKWLGFVGAICTGGIALLTGDTLVGFGIISSALTSVSIFGQ